MFLFIIRHDHAVHQTTHDAENLESSSNAIIHTAQQEKSDHIYNYHRGKLAFGLLLFEFEDAVKECDGARLISVYKLALLFYKCYGHKYAYVTLLYLVKLQATSTQQQSNSLVWNRFYNKYGGKGKNISLDLRMEQLNKLLKSQLRALGSNIKENNAARVANAIEGLELLLNSIDRDCIMSTRKGHRSKGTDVNTVKQIVNDLMGKQVFMKLPEREGYPSFPNFKINLLDELDYRDLHSWMIDLLEKWKALDQNGKNAT